MEERREGKMSPCMQRLHNRSDCRQYPDGATTFDNFNKPPQRSFDTEEMRGSIQHLLSMNIGIFVVIEFLIGTELIIRKQGTLYLVGRSYVTLYDEELNNFITCDIFSVKFIYFYMPGERPRYNYNTLPRLSGEPEPNRRMR